MKIIDAHMHYYDIDKFYEVAENAGHENTAACWQQICQENNIVFAVAMGNSEDAPSRYGGSTPRLINLSGPFDEKNYNQPLNLALYSSPTLSTTFLITVSISVSVKVRSPAWKVRLKLN